jgi:hypothetical protein
MPSKPYQLDSKTPIDTTLRQIDEMFGELYDRPEPIHGKWTPIDTSAGGLTFADQAGDYTKLGPWVILNGYVKFPSTASTSACQIGGLPFPVATGTQARYPASFKSEETTVARVYINASNFVVPTTTADAGITNATLSTNYLYFTILYRTTA